ncbi:MAG: hypothetical protein LUB56_02055 [Coprobacillus sp.]|nr:hypothetical protein [Coprobacillus sp.]
MKTLILVFSRGGRTLKKAKNIQKMIGADLFEIHTDVKYGGYFKALKLAKKEYDSKAEVPSSVDLASFEGYERILVGFPIWYGKCPRVVMTFLSQHDFGATPVYPFCTSGMSAITGAYQIIKDENPALTLGPGLNVNRAKEKDIKNWLGEK